jgi:hypothetical protein
VNRSPADRVAGKIASPKTGRAHTVAAMSISSKWSVVTEHPVGPQDVDADHLMTDEAVDRWTLAAAATYLRQCSTLEDRRSGAGLALNTTVRPRSGTSNLHGATSVAVSATATEVFPRAFVISVRIRPVGGESTDPLDLTCEIRLEDPATGVPQDIDHEIRDELIALEHAARHFN